MVQFVTQHMLSQPSHAGIFVIDVNLQNALVTKEQQEFMAAFPRIHSAYKKICLHGLIEPGKIILSEEKGFHVALLVTKKTRKDDREVVIGNFKKCINELFYQVPSDMFI